MGTEKNIIMKRSFNFWSLMLLILVLPLSSFSQGVGIPSKKWGLGFGNLTTFTGLRFNVIDENIESIKGVNVTVWVPKSFDNQTGSFYGLGIGLPMAMGPENRYGASFALFAVGATEDVMGLNIAGLAVGGNNVYGINLAGLAVGSGEDLWGLNVAGLAVGSGSNVSGINIGGLAVGSGNNLSGLSAAILGVGAGNNVSGVTVGIVAAGAGNKMTGLNVGGLAVGAGSKLHGINIGGLAAGAGESVIGLNASLLAVGSGGTLAGITIAGLAAGAPTVKGLTIALAAGGENVTGITIAPAYFRITNEGHNDKIPTMTGVSISAFNHIQGVQKGLTIGIFNYAHKVKGLQLGLLNYNRANPKGLRWLPILNAGFGKKG
jgi:hypothetical protein